MSPTDLYHEIWYKRLRFKNRELYQGHGQLQEQGVTTSHEYMYTPLEEQTIITSMNYKCVVIKQSQQHGEKQLNYPSGIM